MLGAIRSVGDECTDGMAAVDGPLAMKLVVAAFAPAGKHALAASAEAFALYALCHKTGLGDRLDRAQESLGSTCVLSGACRAFPSATR